MKTYEVHIDMQHMKHYCTKAKNMREAKKKAWDRFKKRPPKEIFTIYAQEVQP